VPYALLWARRTTGHDRQRLIAAAPTHSTLYRVKDDLATRILGQLYALAAAVINDDAPAELLLASEVTDEERNHILEAAVAVSASCIERTVNGNDPFSDPGMATIHPVLRDAIETVLDRGRPGRVILGLHEDAVMLAKTAVARTWLWSAGGDREAAMVIARQHCARLVHYREG